MQPREKTRNDPGGQARPEKDTISLRYRMRTLWLLAIYVPLVIIPWVLTCVLARRPINAPSYIKQQGFSATEVKNLRNWKTAVDVLNSIVALITIPLLSALLAQAAVVFCQRRHAGQFLSLRDMFALADRGWTNPTELWRSMRLSWKRNEMRTKTSGPFLLLAAALIIVGAIQQPLYQILVPTDTTAVTTCSDSRFRYSTRNETYCQDGYSRDYRPLGPDIEPAQMAQIFHNAFLPRVASDLALITVDEEQSNIWSDTMPSRAWYRFSDSYSIMNEDRYRTLRAWLPSFNYDEGTPMPTFFVASLHTNATTGVLREHAMRLNSSVQCKEIDKSAFPSPCPGEDPFATRLQRSEDIDIRVCVPGKVGSFPWTLSRNRQNITEEIYLDLWDGDNSGSGLASFHNVSATIHCEAKTTRGYFELGNLINNNTYGPLLDKWPSREQMQSDYNDYVGTDHYLTTGFIPSEHDTFEGDEPSPPSTLVPSQWWRTSGPLMTSAMAMFNNASWLNNVMIYSANMTYGDKNPREKLDWDRLCAGMPYGRLFGALSGSFPSPAQSCRGVDISISAGFRPDARTLLNIIHQWIEGFAPEGTVGRLTNAESLLQTSLYTANRALLTFYSPNVDSQTMYDSSFRGRIVYTSPGQSIQKPIVSTAAVIVLSMLIGLQLVGLAFLAWYIYRVPTWVDALDAMAIARIGASVKQHDVLPPIGPVTQKDRDALESVDGLVGIHYSPDEFSNSRSRLAPDAHSDMNSFDFELQPVANKGTFTSVQRQNSGPRLGLGADGAITSKSTSQSLVRRRKEESGSEI